MKFKLPRQVINKDVNKIISRELRKQKTSFARVSKDNLKEIAEIVKAIGQSGLPDYLVCKKLSNNLGHGIFLHPSAKPIVKGQVIAPYAGEISLIPKNVPDDGSYAFTPVEDMVLKREEQLLYHKGCRYHPRRLYLLKVDAFKNGNFARFINHSEKPNVVARLVTVPSNPYGVTPALVEVIYFARKTIYPGEQLLVSYEEGEKSYWSACNIKPFSMTPKTFHLDAKGNLKKSIS